MSLSISVVLLLLILAVVFLRNGAMKISHAMVCVLLGFLLAGTSMAPTLQNGLTATAGIVSSLHP
ncbi:hypothetical protein ACFVDQ_00025 [Streptomyces sp. NPDC057684]|jgi:hypothetical protein|uniref:hypothetical protein n=1 Tax=unclassified Streptomyces TaxID=2593676 RepID=UPI000E302EDE|nr:MULTISPECIES: hypothetical protein [unclassified Streptomyces]MCX5441808.1 hypothetical protein [Streptomyces sp. NBC_00063]RFC70391.1 hypothetical protein DXZ75_23870 [Streptomyces sp. AcE210]WSE19008.1 hypothetical protein OG518_39985 [Streptomyces sp. NBC_01397]WUB91925.1 hypothetical protein OHO83_06055 [Streptomyces sp. NBC_00569]